MLNSQQVIENTSSQTRSEKNLKRHLRQEIFSKTSRECLNSLSHSLGVGEERMSHLSHKLGVGEDGANAQKSLKNELVVAASQED